MRTKAIHHNKDLLQSVGDDLGLLAKLHVYQGFARATIRR
jgi:hypothetical protein